MWATLTAAGQSRTLRFERVFPHPIEKVWAALITPERLADWMCADAAVEPLLGGRFHLTFRNFDHSMTGEIIRFEPPHTLEYTWPEPSAGGDSRVLWELTATPEGCRLVLTHTLPTGGDLPGFGSGWHWHLDALRGAIVAIAAPWDEASWRTLQAEYDRRWGGQA